jgi:hypothetical protein
MSAFTFAHPRLAACGRGAWFVLRVVLLCALALAGLLFALLCAVAGAQRDQG